MKVYVDPRCIITYSSYYLYGLYEYFGMCIRDRSVPPYSVVGGNPARIIGSTQEYMTRNTKYNLHCKRMGRKEKMRFLLSVDASKLIRKPYMK